MAGKGRKSRAEGASTKRAGRDGAAEEGAVTDGTDRDPKGRTARANTEADQVKANVKQARADIEGRPRTDDPGTPGADKA